MKTIQIPKELFIKNRFKLKELILPDSSMVIFASDHMPRNGDQFYKFRQNSDFFYLTGINQEKSILIMNPGHSDPVLREVLIILKPSPELETWVGHKLSKEEAREISGIENVFWIDEYERLVFEIVFKSKNLYLNIPENPKLKYEFDSRELQLSRKIQHTFPLHSYHRIAPLLLRLRMIKEPLEIDLINTACSITRSSFIRSLAFLKPGIFEYELEAELTHEFLRLGSSGHAYDPIIASGKSACILHYTDNNSICKPGDLLLMDFGAEWGNYASDCSRTIPVSGRFAARQAEVYDGLLDVFYKLRKMMVPGVKMGEFHQKVCEFMEQLHLELGLYTREDIKNHKGEKGLWFNYYMHGTSHSIGLDVHDVFDKNLEFAPGMFLSCEPAIYIKEENMGIRLENDILITETGNIDLMEDIPIERKEIEELMN
jgi:Xaa-Pro aminopeptidase